MWAVDETEWQDTKDTIRTRIGMALVIWPFGLTRLGERLIDDGLLKTLLTDWMQCIGHRT
jgi:hypothetical protein